MLIKRNNVSTNCISDAYTNMEIIVAIDSSKRNSAFTVLDMAGNVLDVWEFNGKDDGTRLEDTLTLCHVERKALHQIFRGSKPQIVGIENIITKNIDEQVQEGKSKNGMTEHESRFKITAVFNSFISFFQDDFGITPELVNNWAWKSDVLPAQFRKREVGKGSLAYFKSINSPYANYSDDATDSLCIGEHLCRVHKIIRATRIEAAQSPLYPTMMFLVKVGMPMKHRQKLFIYNSNLSLKQNADVIGNLIKEDEVGVTAFPTALLTWEEIYEYCKGDFNVCEETIELAVIRR